MIRREKGIVLFAVLVLAILLLIVGFAVLTIAQNEAISTRIDTDRARAFYLAEAGLAQMQEVLQAPIVGNLNDIRQEFVDRGNFRVQIDTNATPCYVVSVGSVGNVHKMIRAQATFLAPPFENAVCAMNSGGASYAFQLRGKGAPKLSGGKETGGMDQINGNISVNGDIFMYEQSSINAAPAPNRWELSGDAEATGSITTSGGSATIAGSRTPNTEEPEPIDLEAMNYAANNTHNVSQIFQDASVSSGYLPSGNALRNVFVKNPSDRSAECATTTGNDYFFEPSTGFIEGTAKIGATPIHAGDNRVYYVDGDVWVNSGLTYGLKMDGKVTIVATGNIHISDNIEYANKDSSLGLVAVGKYDNSGNLISGGNIFFGDPRYGTMYVASAMMFAAKDFLFNTDAISRATAEPTSGFKVNGSFAAMGKVAVERDWYDRTTTTTVFGRTVTTTTPAPARYNTTTGKWFDADTGAILTTSQVNAIRHYQMIINYDDKVRSPETRPPGLPIGNGTKIFAGFSNWEEI